MRKIACLFFGPVLCTLVNSTGFAARAPSQEVARSIHSWCEARVYQMHRVNREVDALNCADLYFGQPGLDTPTGLFDKSLAYVLRAAALNPINFDTQTTALWLRYSRWTGFQEDPARYPQYQGDLNLAYVLADQMEKNFAKNPRALQALGDQLYPIWFYYDRPMQPRLLRIYRLAESVAADTKLKVRLRLNVGHVHRNGGQAASAIEAYHWVLELDPQNEVALRYLAKLEAGG